MHDDGPPGREAFPGKLRGLGCLLARAWPGGRQRRPLPGCRGRRRSLAWGARELVKYRFLGPAPQTDSSAPGRAREPACLTSSQVMSDLPVSTYSEQHSQDCSVNGTPLACAAHSLPSCTRLPQRAENQAAPPPPPPGSVAAVTPPRDMDPGSVLARSRSAPGARQAPKGDPHSLPDAFTVQEGECR